MAVGQIIGRVAVKVLPDTSDFRRDAQNKLGVIEKTLKLTVATKIDMSGASREYLEQLRTINQRNRVLDSRKIRFHATVSSDGMREAITDAVRRLQEKANQRKIKIEADLVAATAVLELDQRSLDRVRDELDDFRKHNDPLKIKVHPEMVLGSTTVIESRLEYLSRPRRVPLLPYLNSGAVARVATALGALSGARVVVGYFRDMAEWLGNLDKHVPLIGSLALAIAGLAGWGLTAASNLFALSASLAQIGPAALVLPGILGGVVIGLITTIAALKDFNTVLPEVKGQFTALQDAISTNFWAVAAAPIRALIGTLLPQLSAGLKQSATELGGYFAALAKALTGVFDGAVAGMFANLSASITIAANGTNALAGIIATLGAVGAGYLPQLAQWFVDIAVAFNAFLGAAAADGSLKSWIDTGVTGLADLGRVLAGLGSILAGIATAANAAGGSTLGTLGDTLQRIADIVNGPVFQTTLITVLTAAHAAMDSIAQTAGPAVATMFQTLAGTLAAVLPVAANAIGTLLQAVASALADPTLQVGIGALFAGLATAVQALAPVLGPISQALGGLGQVVGVMAAALGPLVATVFGAFAQALTTLLPAIQPLIIMLSGALTTAFQALAPVILQVVQAFSSLISGGLMQALQTAIGALAPVISTLAPILGQVLVTALGAIVPILTALAPIIGQVVGIVAGVLATVLPQLMPLLTLLGTTIGAILTAVAPLIGALLQLVMAVLGPLLTVIINIVSAALPPFLKAIQALVPALMPVIAAITAVVTFLVGLLAPALQWLGGVIITAFIDIIDGIAKVFTGVVDIVLGVWNIFAGLFTGDWARVWDGVKQLFTGIWELIVGAFEVIINIGILGVARKGLALLKGLWDGIWTGIKTLAELVWSGLKHNWETFLATLKAAPGAALDAIVNLFKSCWNVIRTGAQAAWNLVKDAFVTGVATARIVVMDLPGRVRDGLGDLASTLLNAGKRLIEGLITGIKSMFGSVKDTLGDLTRKLTDWKGPASHDRVLLVGAGQLLIEGLITGLESRYGAVRKSLSGLTSDISAMTLAGPGVTGVPGVSAVARMGAAADAALADGGRVTKVLNYYAAAGSSITAEEDLFKAAGRARMVGW